ncbi:MAG: cytochrome c oxidase accessory protein CcoG [Candidatus Muproteobacteria bacterium RBG_16_64_11]|uniref:Cytochrome c oxidase accessory protein CcoG n=1 Tax=Candidatus Muproteobacteria bacterium RBG_16_64_11 TaxID=1817758 RepID=A0A1F6TEG1_9PROT|nr:MAG: cytochrome c oxidase accessory protein CcoG [Candidatus Muproteobacteria bacterium RBG_16_64_11]
MNKPESTAPRPTNQGAGADQGMYAKHQKVYPREVHGVFAFWRSTGVFVLLGLYYGLPWLRWDGRQAVLLDLPERKFHIFALTFWPQDFFYLALILIVAALTLFFFTALAGRLWCGYACPQTVWTEVFLRIERLVEGDRARQMTLADAPWGARKVLIKAAKQTLWLVFAAYTGLTFVGYFTPILEVARGLLDFSLGPWETFWIAFYSLATYGNAGFLREQVCIYMCPYARFQSAMFDKNTLIISYDRARGEPRGSRRRGDDYRAKGLGHCIDCTLCVQVCPTGIDIRHGLQYQCIGCAACVDVCDQVMEKMQYPKGLIRYTTENALLGKAVRILRPRVLFYGALLLAMVAGLGYALATRLPLELDVIRDRNALFRETDGGLIENVYTLKILNMDDVPHSYRLTVQGIANLQLHMHRDRIDVPAGEVMELPVRLQVDPGDLSARSSKIAFTLRDRDDPALTVTEDARFLGPAPGTR